MKELLQKIYELILGLLEPVIEWLRKLWEMPAEDFLDSLASLWEVTWEVTWAVIGPLLKFFGIVIIGIIFVLSAFIIVVMIRTVIQEVIQAIAVHRERKHPS